LILVTTGMFYMGFDRLVEGVDELVRDGAVTQEVFLQTGFAAYEPRHCPFEKVVPFEELGRLMRECRILVTHGGAGLIADGLELGKPVIAVPRREKHKEHVNDHQLELTGALEKAGRIVVLHEIRDLPTALEAVMALEHYGVSEDKRVLRVVDDYLQSLAAELNGGNDES
jgi:UDP-N-acetylglucosamine transferase subunit ALG13